MRKFLLVMLGVLYSKTVFLRQLSRQMRHCLKGNTLLLVILLQLLFMLKGFLFFVSEDVIRCRDAKRCRVPSSVVPHCNPFKDNFCVWHQNFSSILRVILRLYTVYAIIQPHFILQRERRWEERLNCWTFSKFNFYFQVPEKSECEE